jgi:ABC-type transporter Mla MlaB component
MMSSCEPISLYLRSEVTRETVLVISGPIDRSAIAGLCERTRVLLERSDADLVVCDVGALLDPDVVTVEALARLQLTARRMGRQVRILGACAELADLLTLSGLSEIVPPCPELPLESRGQVEQREPASGIEEERDPADPIA